MKLQLAKELELPVDAVTQTFAFLARRGAGKTYGASKLCEEMIGAGGQVVVLDPVGNWWGLRLAADGKSKGLTIPVFGGLRGDIPLEPGAGALVADLVVDKELSVVLDVSMFRKGDRKRFATDFAEQLFHRKKEHRTPLHLFVEEAQVFVPQRAIGDEARMLGAFEDLVKLGRNFGVGVTLISQRPQSVNKDALNQTECLVVLQTNGSQERKALKEWIVDQGLDVAGLIDTLPGLKKGEAWVWSPSWLGITKRVHIAKKKTFNASATPELGAKQVAARELAPVDLDAIQTAMKATIEAAATTDPKALRKRVAQLEAELAKRPAAKVETKVVEKPVITDAQMRALDAAVEKLGGFEPAIDKLMNATQSIQDALCAWKGRPSAGPKAFVLPTPPPRRGLMGPVYREARASVALDGQTRSAGETTSLRAGERKMLEVLARGYPAKRSPAQVGTLSGFTPSGGTFRTYLGVLKREGLVEEQGGRISITGAGLDLVGAAAQQPQSTEEVLGMWRNALRAGERKMLDTLVSHYPESMSRGSLGGMTGFAAAGGTFRTYLGVLVRNGLVEVDHDEVRASGTLFVGERAA